MTAACASVSLDGTTAVRVGASLVAAAREWTLRQAALVTSPARSAALPSRPVRRQAPSTGAYARATEVATDAPSISVAALK